MKKLFIALFALILMSATMYGQDMQLVIQDDAGNIAIFDVTAGVVAPNLGGCPGCGLGFLYTPGAFDPDHGQLLVTGTIGQFTVTITGQGGGFVTAPTLQNLNEIDAASEGEGTLNVTWTDTDYTSFGDDFALSASGTYSASLADSSSDFVALASAANTVPAGTVIDALLNLECTADPGEPCSFAVDRVAANPVGPSGSLTTTKEIRFSDAGEIQLNLSIASVIPEPGSVLLLGTMLLGTGISLRRKFGR